MGRPKKITTETPIDELSDAQLQNILNLYAWNDSSFKEFASSANNSYLYPSVFNPMLTNARMQAITLNANGEASEARVAKALASPRDSEQELLSISEILEYSNPTYKRIISYLSNLPAWDYTIYCKNIGKSSNYKSKEYDKALDVVKDFMFRFDVKSQFPSALRQLLRQETFFTVFRDEGDRFVLQELPSNYCLITGRWDYGLLFSFNYYYFAQGGIDIDLYPSIFKETYTKVFKGQNITDYNPSASVDARANSMWVQWGDCSPMDGFWGWKFSNELASRIPAFASLFPDFAMLPTVRSLQRNAYLVSAAKLVFSELPFLKDAKATVRDAVSMSPKLLGEFMALVKSGLTNDSVKFTSAPVQNIQGIEFEHDNEMYATYSKNVTGQSGINGNLISSTSQKMNSLETGLSASVDEMMAMSIYPYFNQFMEFQINKRLKDKDIEYRFGFNFEGTNFYTDRQRRLDTQISLMSQGVVLPQKVAAATGQDIFAMQEQMNEARERKWTENLTPIVPASQQAGGGKESGRPSKSDDELGEEGMNTRDAGSNLAKSVKNKK